MIATLRAYLFPWPNTTPPQHPTPAQAVAASVNRHSSARAS